MDITYIMRRGFVYLTAVLWAPGASCPAAGDFCLEAVEAAMCTPEIE
jgi:hypothetical protein